MTNSKPYVKLTGRPKKSPADKRANKVSATFTDDEFRQVKAKAERAGLTVAELLRVGVFRLSIAERLTEFEREAIRELMAQGKNLNLITCACLANAWASTHRKADMILDKIWAILDRLKLKNDSLL